MPLSFHTPLSIHRAFVVQFGTATDMANGRCEGRVEHVVTGQVDYFDTCAELTAFIARVLHQVHTQRPDAALRGELEEQ